MAMMMSRSRTEGWTVPQLPTRMICAGAVLPDQLGDVDGDRRDAHAVGHDRDRHALELAGEAQHVADIGDLSSVGEEIVGDVFGSQRITRHQDDFREITGLGVHVFGGHGCSILLSGATV